MKSSKKTVSRKSRENKDMQPKDFSLRHKIVNGKGLLWLEGKISSRVTLVLEPVIKNFQKKGNKIKEINFFISGQGGDFYACLKVINLIEKLSDKLTIVAFNEVKSGSFLATQSRCRRRLAIPNTKFIFHRARDIFSQNMMDDNFTMGQEEYRGRLDRLMVIDAMQLIKFIEKGKPISKIIELFREEATLSVKRALKYKLIDGMMGKNKFLRYQKQLSEKQT